MKIYEITLLEEQTGKLVNIVPGAEATVDMGDGTKTIIDLKKNPTALAKSPDGKIMMNKSGITSGGVQTQQPDPKTMMKPGEPVFMANPTGGATMEADDEPVNKVIKGPHGRLNIDRSKKGVTRVTRRGYRTDEPDRDKKVGRGRIQGSTGHTPGVGVPQKTSFSNVPHDFAARRARPKFDFDNDEEVNETDMKRRKFLASLGALAAGAGLGHAHMTNQLKQEHQDYLKQADYYTDRGEDALRSRDYKSACLYFDRAADSYEKAGMDKFVGPMKELSAKCKQRAGIR